MVAEFLLSENGNYVIQTADCCFTVISVNRETFFNLSTQQITCRLNALIISRMC